MRLKDLKLVSLSHKREFQFQESINKRGKKIWILLGFIIAIQQYYGYTVLWSITLPVPVTEIVPQSVREFPTITLLLPNP